MAAAELEDPHECALATTDHAPVASVALGADEKSAANTRPYVTTTVLGGQPT